jgi:uncharacterized Tic20 family protein
VPAQADSWPGRRASRAIQPEGEWCVLDEDDVRMSCPRSLRVGGVATMSQASAGPLHSIALRGGDSLVIWSDRVVAAGRNYPLAELTGAAFSVDPANRSGASPWPAISLRGRDGVWATYVPADPPDAQRALEAIYARRPDLRVVPGPPAAAPYGASPAPSGGETVLAGIAHLSIFFAPILLPLVIWLAAEQSAPYASRQGKQAFVFHLGLIGVAILVVVAALAVSVAAATGAAFSGDNRGLGLAAILFLLGGLALFVVEVVGIGYSIYGAIEAFQGRPFSYPFLQRL